MKRKVCKQVPALLFTMGSQGRIRHNVIRMIEVMVTLRNLSFFLSSAVCAASNAKVKRPHLSMTDAMNNRRHFDPALQRPYWVANAERRTDLRNTLAREPTQPTRIQKIRV